MTPSIAKWLLSQSKRQRLELIHELPAARRLAVEMMARQRGEDGWNATVWKGEGTKARKDLADLRKSIKAFDAVIEDLEKEAGK